MSQVGDEPDEDIGMWIIQPDFDADSSPHCAVIHLDCILHAVYLIGKYGKDFLQEGLTFNHTLETFDSLYVNKYIDHYAFKIMF